MCLYLGHIAYVDWKIKKITNKSIFVTGAMSLLSILIFPQINGIERVAGSVIVSLPLFVIYFFFHRGIGGGDIKLMAVSGLGLGAAGIWKAFIIGVYASGIYVILLLMRNKGDRKTEIAMGPFLSLGLIISWIAI